MVKHILIDRDRDNKTEVWLMICGSEAVPRIASGIAPTIVLQPIAYGLISRGQLLTRLIQFLLVLFVNVVDLLDLLWSKDVSYRH